MKPSTLFRVLLYSVLVCFTAGTVLEIARARMVDYEPAGLRLKGSIFFRNKFDGYEGGYIKFTKCVFLTNETKVVHGYDSEWDFIEHTTVAPLQYGR